jgi:hypothetical protein
MTLSLDYFRKKIGWCPNQPTASVSPSKTNSWIFIIAVICILIIPASTLFMLSPASQNVAVWAFRVDDTGTRHFVTRLPAMEDANGKLSFSPAEGGTQSLPAGKYWLVIERPGSDGSYRLALDGQWVKGTSSDFPENGMNLFKVSGPGSLQQEDAYQALLVAFGAGMSNDTGSTTTQKGSNGISEREYVIEK